MPKKKEETTMLVRAVPLEVSERVRRHCKREGIRYREFLERAIDLLEEPNREPGQDAGRKEGVDEKVNPLQRVAEIAETVKAYKNAIRLMRDLGGILKNLSLLTDWENQKHIYLDVVKMVVELSGIIREYIPKHEIPDDPEVMAAMGLPPELIYKMDLTAEEFEQKTRRDAEAAEQWKKNHKSDDVAVPEELKKRMEEILQQFREADPEDGVKPTKDPATPLTGQEQVPSESKAASAEPSEDAKKHEAGPQPRKKEN